MTAKGDNKKPGKGKTIDQQYFEEARGWDSNAIAQTKLSERRAWRVAGVAVTVAILEAIGISAVLPLKTVEPFVIRVDNNTGLTDVISTLKEKEEGVKATAQEALNKYWLAQYIRHREGYLWDTRNYDREMVGLLSAPAIQQQYAEYTDPRKNPQAPIVVYGQNSEVETKDKAISMLNAGEELEGETRYTAMVRYTKQVRRAGEFSPLTHWAATITFAYRNEPMKLDDRTKNPLGFQVISYRNDQETGGL